MIWVNKLLLFTLPADRYPRGHLNGRLANLLCVDMLIRSTKAVIGQDSLASALGNNSIADSVIISDNKNRTI